MTWSSYTQMDFHVLYFLFPRVLPQAMCTSQRIYCCFGQMEARVNSNMSKPSLVTKFSSGWTETQSLFLKQTVNNYSLPLGALLTSKTQDVSTMAFNGDEKIGVLLLNLGGPETLDDVQPFLFNLFADPVKCSFVLYASCDLCLSHYQRMYYCILMHLFCLVPPISF
ncbi:hypothetical protein CsSME_00003035 [Camellia sinensis var. sinensis]